MKKVINTILNIILTLVFIFSAVIMATVVTSRFNAEGIPSIGNKSVMTVRTDSMTGDYGFDTDDVIIIDRVDDEQAKYLQVGQVITFRTNIYEYNVLLTHRIVGAYQKDGIIYYITRGDNAPANDTDAVPSSSIVGVWNSWDSKSSVDDLPETAPETGTIEDFAVYETSETPLTGKKLSGIGTELKSVSSRTGIFICVVAMLMVLLFSYIIKKAFGES